MKHSLTYERIREGSTLPTPTGVALAILRMASTEETRIERMAAVVETDPAISARLLQYVNSPLAGIYNDGYDGPAITLQMVKNTVDAYFTGFKKVKPWREGVLREAKRTGYVREMMPTWKTTRPGVETMTVAVMGCVV